ncbi:uncharacterized protein BJ212DRAFT_1281980 [Suillus subaureus]|uniref:HAT C-terminal dimerisation domain-containing protein n=1 Tax=Suillus subaureus TaxID=48587 RepID=A0A9P7J882_9AGAM|nr:uncharacterized protein BJ212DRAFT_1281980 [Suillus subaureus]KAG1807464.1 hypothetical protein BJ212DRAFT_1281980 [Suillus subaureus]
MALDSQVCHPRILFSISHHLLSRPATSTAVERVFSQGRRLIHFTRHRLVLSTIRASLSRNLPVGQEWSSGDGGPSSL